MIDLSFLTEEEQEAIMKVLQRDAELKRAEEERVRHLPEKVKDDVQLKNMSGQWFYEAKSKRHRDKIHGADIIRASMRRKPATLAEVSQNKSNKVKNSWVSNVNKEVFVPPELHGIVEHEEEQPQLKSSSSSKPITSMLDKPEERFMKAAVSPVKQRRNPFNSTASGDNLASGESENRPAILQQLSNKGLTEILSLSEDSQPKPNLENYEMERSKKPSVEPTDESQKEQVKHPVPKARKLIHKATDAVSQREGFVPKPAKRTERVNGIGTPPRGILKRTSSSSSTDSEVRVSQMLDVQKKNALPTVTIFEGDAEKNSPKEEVGDSTRKVEDSTQISLEKLKQVRFSSSTGKGEPLQSPQLRHGREKGEFDLLESDEIKSSGNDGIRSDSFRSKQISALKPSSALQVKTIDGLQDDTLASGACDTNKSVFLVNETLQSKPKKLGTPQKTSSNIQPDSNKELGVDEMRENKANQFLSHESKLRKNFTDEHQLSAKTEAHEVSNTNSTSLQQGKPDLVEKRDAKTTFKPDKHADELMKVADESLSKVLDWFERSSGTEDTKHVSARSQGREPKEEVDFSARTVTLPTEHSGPSMDGKTEVAAELPFRKIKQQNTISPPFILENIQLIKEGMKPKKEEENEKQNDKSLTEFDCTRDEEKEHGQEIKEQNKKSNLLEHEEQKPLAQKCESEKAIQEKRRIREIRAFWERNKTIPSHEEKEININTNAAGGGALKGLRESDKIQPTAEYLSNILDDQSKNMLRSGELSCASQASIKEHQNSFEFGPGHVVEQPERTLASDEVHEFTELPKIVNLQPSVGATSLSPESEDKHEKEALKGKVSACSQQKPSFQVLFLKEKVKEKSKNQISGPSQFQSLRNFWDTRVKLQSSVDRGDASLPINTRLITYERKLEEDEGSVNVSKQELIQQQTQILEQEKNQKLDSVVHELPVGSSTLNGLNMTHMKNTDSVQLDRKLVISKRWEKMGLPEQEIKERIEKSAISPKETPVFLQLLQSSGDKDALKETMVDDLLCSPIEKVENKTALLDINLPKEEVAETVDEVILPKAELDVFKLGLKKLEKEASEMSTNLKLKENISKETTFHSNQCQVSERTAEQSHDISHAYQKEEISKSTGKPNVLSTDEHENVKSFRKLLREFEPFCLRLQAADKDDTLGCSQRHQGDLQNLLRKTFTFQPSECRKMGIKSLDDTNSISQTNRSVESTFQEDTDQPEEVNETTEKSVAPSKFNRLTSALEKLLKEASETPPPKPKHAEGTVHRTAETEVKSMAYRCDHNGELPQEIRETVEKSFAPSKVSGLTSALEKLLKEASELPPANPKRADNTVQRTVEMEVKSMTYDHNRELLQEIRETIEKSVAPSKVSGLTAALEKLLKEASEMLPAKPKRSDGIVQRTAEKEGKSMTYEHGGELLQEIGETIEKSVAPSKVSGLTSALEKLLEEASEMLPAKPKHSDGTVQRTAEKEGKSMTSEHDRELSQEIRETIENSVAPSMVSGLTSALEKLLKEASESPPAKPKRADCTVQRTAEKEGKSMTSEHDGELSQEIRETIEKSVAPSMVSGLTSALEKLLKEASESPPAKPKRADGTVQRTVDMQVRSMTSEHDGELPQEIRETIEKSVAPSKVSGLTSALEKLLKEASEMLPAKPKHSDGMVQRTAETEGKSMTYEHDGELSQEIRETIEKSVAPCKGSSLTSALAKLLKEASETPPAKPKRSNGAVWETVDMQVRSTTYEHNGELPQEIRETIEESVVPSKVSVLTSASEELLKEASETPPAKPKCDDNTVQKTVEMEVKNMISEHDGELPQEIRETIEKSVAPSKVSSLTSTSEKQLEEASEMLPAKPKGADNTVQKTVKMEFKSTTCDHDGELPEKIGETLVRSALSKYDCIEFDVKKLLDEVSETPASLLKNMDKKTPGKIEAGQSVHSPHQRGRDHSQETEETIEKTYVSNTAKFSEFSISSEKLLKEPSETSSPISKELHKQEKFGDHMFPSQKATLFVTMSQPYSALSSYHTQMKTAIKGGPPEQNIKTSINDLAISETEASDLPERNRAINKIEERNMAPADLSPLEGETNMIAVKPFEINEEGRRDESTSLDDSVDHSEFKALLKFRRASTPLKDESSSFQSEGVQLCLMSLPEDNDEEEGEGSNSGFNFLDENFDSHCGTGSSIRSEEELNPVLMALKRSADRKMPSKSLEDIPSATSNKGKIKNTKEELALSAEDVSTVPSQPDKLFSHPEKLKGLSKSVPSFLQEESDDRETDTASESSYSLRRIKKSPSSLTNLSGSSGMASLSSVSSSLMSIYSADFGNVDVKGNIQFAIDYVEQLNELHILICQCKDLAVADVKRQRSDPYVKTYLLPEKYKLGKRKTSVKKKTFNPVYNEILRYKTEKGLLKNQSLNISVWHNDTFGRNSFLGEVELDLGTWDWNDKSNKQINWYPLKPRTSTTALEPENRGEMKVALQYVPHPVGGKKTLYTGEVHIWVKECHDLPILRGNRLNSFIKCTVLPDTSRKSRQKTRTVAKTTNPVFNHTMVYDGFRPEDLKEACIELTVWDHHKLANHFLGGLRIGLGTGKSYGTTVDWMDSTSDESALWEKMMNSPNTWIEDTLPLRMLMVAKLTK